MYYRILCQINIKYNTVHYSRLYIICHIIILHYVGLILNIIQHAIVGGGILIVISIIVISIVLSVISMLVISVMVIYGIVIIIIV